MKYSDRLNRIYSEKLKLRIYTAETLHTARQITEVHKTTPNATVALARTITAAVLMSATLKPESNQNVSVKFSGGGPIGEVQVQADAIGNIRGYAANPAPDLDADIGEISFSKTIGPGFLTITKDLEMKTPYSGVVPLRTGEIASEIAWYLADSEQTPSAVIIALELDKKGVVSVSGGIMIQTLPDTEEGVIEKIESNITGMQRSLGEILNSGEPILSALNSILESEDYEIMSSLPLKPNCKCSRELLLAVLKNIKPEELHDMAEKDNGAHVYCTFCAKEYNFSAEDLLNLIK